MGLLFMISSKLQKVVLCRSLSSTCNHITPCKNRFTVRIRLSQTPPICDVVGGLNSHLMFLCNNIFFAFLFVSPLVHHSFNFLVILDKVGTIIRLYVLWQTPTCSKSHQSIDESICIHRCQHSQKHGTYGHTREDTAPPFYSGSP